MTIFCVFLLQASYAILERRENLGGTWDFFKYPGIRSDSDMYTFGFSWKIWKSAKPIAPAKDILDYLKEAAEEQGIVEKIQFNTDVKSADWKSNDNCWHIVTSKGVR
jgi:monooxygenase